MEGNSDPSSLREACTLNLASPTTYWGVGIQMLGYAIVKSALETAAIGLLGKGTTGYYLNMGKRNLVNESIVFVKGTGLNTIIHQYHLEGLDADRLKEDFYEWINRHRKSQS